MGVGGLDALDDILEVAGVRGERRDDGGAVGEGDDHDLRARRGAAEREEGAPAAGTAIEGLGETDGLFFGKFEACAPIGFARVHGGGAVDEQDDAFGVGDGGAHDRARERENREDEDQQLQQQEQILAELLEGGVDLEVLDGALPKQRRRDSLLAAAELEEIENEQSGNDTRGNPEGPQIEETHHRTPEGPGGF